MQVAQRLSGQTPSIIREMTRLAHEHQAINMAQGFPEFDPPPEVKAAAQQAIENGRNQYSITWGTVALRQAIAAKYERFYGMKPDPATDITVTCGVTEGVIVALMALIDPDDPIVVLDPAHENYWPGIKWAGGTPIWVPLEPPDFTWDENRLRDAFRKRPKAIVLNTPSNPSGRVLTRAELQTIANLCQNYDTIAITDEIYEHMIYDGRKHIPLATLPGMAERTVTISGLSKTYAATGWRVGWIVAPSVLSDALRTVHDYLTICAPTPLQEAATVAVQLGDDFHHQLVERYTQCRTVTIEILRNAGFHVDPPEGAYYVMADFSAIQPHMDDVEFTRWLITERQIAVVPGSSFYHDNSGLGHSHVRFAFPKHTETLAQVRQRVV